MMDDVERATLAFACGVFASGADAHFGGHRYGVRARQNADSLTQEMLKAWVDEARRDGMPDEFIKQALDYAAEAIESDNIRRLFATWGIGQSNR